MSIFYVPAGMSFAESIATGLVDNRIGNAIALHKFGYAALIDDQDVPCTVWDGCCEALDGPKIANYTFSSTANITDIASGAPADNQVIEIQGLDANWNLLVQDVTLTGNTVATLATPLIRVFRMINRGTTDHDGTVYLTTSGAARTNGIPNVGSTVRAIIKSGDNQTQMALFTVPDGYSMFITHAWSSLTKENPNSPANLIMKVYRREFGGVFRVVHTVNLNTLGSSIDNRPYAVPIKFNSREDIIYKCVYTSEDDLGCAAGFHAYLLENSRLPTKNVPLI